VFLLENCLLGKGVGQGGSVVKVKPPGEESGMGSEGGAATVGGFCYAGGGRKKQGGRQRHIDCSGDAGGALRGPLTFIMEVAHCLRIRLWGFWKKGEGEDGG